MPRIIQISKRNGAQVLCTLFATGFHLSPFLANLTIILSFVCTTNSLSFYLPSNMFNINSWLCPFNCLIQLGVLFLQKQSKSIWSIIELKKKKRNRRLIKRQNIDETRLSPQTRPVQFTKTSKLSKPNISIFLLAGWQITFNSFHQIHGHDLPKS